MNFDSDSFEAESPPRGASLDNSSSVHSDDESDFDLPGMDSLPRPVTAKGPRPVSMLPSSVSDNKDFDGEDEFGSVPAQPQLRRPGLGSSSSSLTHSDSDGDGEPSDPAVGPAPPIPISQQNWSRKSEFDSLNAESIFYSPLSPESIVISDLSHGYLFMYRTYLGCLGKFQIEFVGEQNIYIQWHTYNTLIPGIQESYCEGTAEMVLGDESKYCFNLSYGCYSDLSTVAGKKGYGMVPSDVAFLQQSESTEIIIQAVNGTFLHDYNPNMTGGGIPDIVKTCTDDFVSIRWNPPHVLCLSDHSILSIQGLLGKVDGLNQPQVDTLIKSLFGRNVMEQLQEWMAETGGDEDSVALLAAALHFVESGFVNKIIWDLSFRNGEASALILIQLIDAIVVSGDLSVVAEFFVCLLFGRKKTVSKGDLKYLLRNIIGADPDLDHPVLNDVFKRNRKATKSDIRYAMNFNEELVTAVRYFAEIAELVSRVWEWDQRSTGLP